MAEVYLVHAYVSAENVYSFAAQVKYFIVTIVW